MSRVPTLPSLVEVIAHRRARLDARNADGGVKTAKASPVTDQMRKAEAVVEQKRKKDIKRRRDMDVSNLKLEPARGRVGVGKEVRVNRATGNGYLLAMHAQSSHIWTAPMVGAGNRFSQDFDASEYRGLGAMAFEPRVDGGGGGDSLPARAIACRARLRDLEARIGEDCYTILALVCGEGRTLSDMERDGIGQRKIMGDLLRTALSRAAAFYSGSRSVPDTPFMARVKQRYWGGQGRGR